MTGHEVITMKKNQVKKEKDYMGETRKNRLSPAHSLVCKNELGQTTGSARMNESKRPEKPFPVETNRYYHGLTEGERGTFDREARRLHRSKSKPTLTETRELRQNYFGLMKFAQSTYFPDSEAVEEAAQALIDYRTTTTTVRGELACA